MSQPRNQEINKPRFKVGVRIMPREVILDTQGRAIEQNLKQNNFNLESCRAGRFIELVVAGPQDQALAEAKKMTEFVLYNPLIEKFELIPMGAVE